MKKTIAIAMGGYTSECDVSLQSGKNVYEHLKNDFNVYQARILKDDWHIWHDAQKFPINKSDFSVVINGKKIRFDVVFNTIHGTPGEDGLIQGYFQNLNIKQTAAEYYNAALTYNKRDCISVLKAYGIPTADNYFYNKGDKIDVQAIVNKVGLPCFVKANRAGSSFGITKVKTKDKIPQAIAHALKEDDEIIIESFLNGREVSVGVINYRGKVMALPVTEIISENEFFDFEAKYYGKSQELTPAQLTQKETQTVQDLAVKIFKILKMKGMTRSEFIFHKGQPHFLEINACPGLTKASILPQQAQAGGISLNDLFTNAIEMA